jgi:hypothetical protein
MLDTRTKKHEKKLDADCAEKISHEKAQKTSAFVPIPLGLRTDRRRKINHESTRMDTNFLDTD